MYFPGYHCLSMAETVLEQAPMEVQQPAEVTQPLPELEAPAIVVSDPVAHEVAEAAPAPAPAPAPELEVIPVPAEAVPAPAEVVPVPAEAVPEAPAAVDVAAEPPKKKKPLRITLKTIASVISARRGIFDQLFTWKEWEELGEEVSDATFFKCELLADIRGADGAVALAKGSKVKRIDWYASMSAAVLYPDGKLSSAIVYPLNLDSTLSALPLVC